MWGNGMLVLLAQVGAAEAEAAPAAEAVSRVAQSLGVLTLLAVLLAVKAGFVGMALWTGLLFPGVSAAAYERYRTHGQRCFWIGLVNVAAGILLALLLMATQVLALLGILLLVFMGFLAVLGYAAAYRHLGERLLGLSGADSTKPLLLGGLAAEAAFLVPVLGQALSLGVLVRGLGAVVLALMAVRRSAAGGHGQTRTDTDGHGGRGDEVDERNRP